MPLFGKTALVTGLLLCDDFFFTSKITGTAAALGLVLKEVSRVEAAVSALQEECPELLIVDLSAASARLPELLAALPPENRPAVIAFDAHIHAERLRQARQAGCDVVLPRSRFSADLPALLQRLVTGKAGDKNKT